MEKFPISILSFEDLLSGYRLEADGLAAIAAMGHFRTILERFRDYEDFLRGKQLPGSRVVSKLARQTGIINAAVRSTELHDIFCTAHFAACCELFNGIDIPVSNLGRSDIAIWVDGLLDTYRDADEAQIERLSTRLHSMDAVRTISIVRCMGLLRRTHERVHQLSLGAGPATKDIRSIHLTPRASWQAQYRTGPVFRVGKFISMSVCENYPVDIIVTDNDPQREAQYKLLNRSVKPRILALNEDAGKVLEILPEIMQRQEMQPRNLVIALRIDHRMIPDASEFMGRLALSIDATADLLVTIGAGFNIEDYKRRTDAMSDLFATLRKAGLNPVLVKLHGNGGLESQRTSPSFGLSSITTYEIVYCKLIRKKLLKAFPYVGFHR